MVRPDVRFSTTRPAVGPQPDLRFSMPDTEGPDPQVIDLRDSELGSEPDARAVLGVSDGANWAELAAAHRRRLDEIRRRTERHTDRVARHEVNTAYATLRLSSSRSSSPSVGC